MRKSLILGLALALGLAAAVFAGGKQREEKVTLDEVPEAVKATILKEAKGANITEIEKETKNGKVVYEAEFVVGGKEVEIKVDPSGKLLSRKVEEEDDDEVSLNEVPAAVKATILKETKGGKIKEIEREKEDGKIVYEVEFVLAGKKCAITVDPAGKLLGKEVAVTLDEVPAPVKATILKEAKGAKIKEIEKETKNGRVIYEAEFVVDGKEVEIKVDPSGKLLGREVEKEDDDKDDDDDDNGN